LFWCFLLRCPFSLCFLFLYCPLLLIGIWSLLLFLCFCTVCLFIVVYPCSLFFYLLLLFHIVLCSWICLLFLSFFVGCDWLFDAY
jgi:hypothetical protein